MAIRDYTTVLIIGNGFDLALGYKTSYKDFYQSTEFRSLIGENALVTYINEHNKNASNIWSDLEQMLSHYSMYYCDVINQNNLSLAFDTYQHHDIVTDVILKDKDGEILKKEYEQLISALSNYLRNALQYTSPNIDVISAASSIVEKWLSENHYSCIISLNYSESIENLAKTYAEKNSIPIGQLQSISIPQICYHHVHGTLPTGIVVGIDECMKIKDKQHIFLKKSISDHYDNRGLNKIFESAQRYIIFGCSMGNSDAWYYNKIFQSQTSKIYEIYYFGEKEKNTIQSRVEEFSGIDMAEFKEKHNVVFIDCSNLSNIEKQRNEYYSYHQRLLPELKKAAFLGK